MEPLGYEIDFNSDIEDNFYFKSHKWDYWRVKSFLYENKEYLSNPVFLEDFLTSIEKDSSISNKFITFDLETRTIKGKMTPFCVSMYFIDSGKGVTTSFYLTDYTSPEKMLEAAIEFLLKSKFDGYKIYVHNLSNFEAVILLRVLSNIKTINKIRPIIRGDRFLNIAIDFGSSISQKDSKYTIYFRDSYLMLPNSLKDLAINFNVGSYKGIYPYSFVNNPDVKLNYKGVLPDIKYFDNITKEQYIEYSKGRTYFDLEFETMAYCEQDCVVLHKVIETFSLKIFNLFKVDIHSYTTLPSLTMAIFRSNFF